ncbi:hypothetical protein HY732_02505 [Candidatus Uhrbacteria bacterium]|nr:hypothetical protein [Candidatus Uhrbacteria bacterium]
MKRNFSQCKQKLIVIGWLGLAVFALYASIFFLSSQHMALVTSPCAGMSNAVCPILQYDLLSAEFFITRVAQPEIPHAINTVVIDTYIMTALLFALLSFVGAWRHIRKRNYLYRLVHRYMQAFSRGIIQSTVYA